MKGNLFLHIGEHKTGTTFLQRNFFPNLSKVYFIDGCHPQSREVSRIIRKDFFKENKNNLMDYIHKDTLVSYEGLWENPYSKEITFPNRINIIKKMFPRAKIIMGLREFDFNFICSLYSTYVAGGGCDSIQDFYNEHINPQNFEKDFIKKNLYDSFDEENLYIYNYKEFKYHPYKVLESLCKFIGSNTTTKINMSRVNKSYSNRQLTYLKLFNHLFKTKLNKRGIIPWNPSHLPHRVCLNIITGRYYYKNEVKKLTSCHKIN